MNIGIFPPRRLLPRFRTLYFVHRQGAALMTNGKPDESTREMTETEIAFAKMEEAEKLSKKRVKGKLVVVDANKIELTETKVREITPFTPANPKHFRSRRRNKAYRFANARGGQVAKYEMLVIN